MGNFNDHPVKKVIRERWCKPLIKHLSEHLGCKLTYLGLPGLEAIDVLSWLEYINKVIAFDVGDYSGLYNEEKAKENINHLSKILSRLERQGNIDTYSLYHGYIEEVVLRGIDRAATEFKQYGEVTIYNLDFCNTLTAPLKLTDPHTGEVFTYYKTDVIRHLLELQRFQATTLKKSKFIFYITVHSQFWESESENLFVGDKKEFYNNYRRSLEKLDKQNRNIRLLRLFMIEALKNQFCSHQFIPEFLPTLYYKGVGNNWLLCFTVIGTYFKNPAGLAPFNQEVNRLINEKFIQPTDDGVEWLVQENVKEKNCILDPVVAIQSLKT